MIFDLMMIKVWGVDKPLNEQSCNISHFRFSNSDSLVDFINHNIGNYYNILKHNNSTSENSPDDVTLSINIQNSADDIHSMETIFYAQRGRSFPISIVDEELFLTFDKELVTALKTLHESVQRYDY